MSDEAERRFVPGDLIVFEDGAYSDRVWTGPVRVKRSFTNHEAIAAFSAAWKPDPEDSWNNSPSAQDFMPWLVAQGWVEDAGRCYAWHVGDYNGLDSSWPTAIDTTKRSFEKEID